MKNINPDSARAMEIVTTQLYSITQIIAERAIEGTLPTEEIKARYARALDAYEKMSALPATGIDSEDE